MCSDETMSEGAESPIAKVSHGIAKVLELAIGLPATAVVAACVAILAVVSVISTGYSQVGGDAGTISVLSEFGSSGLVRQLFVPLVVALCEVVLLVGLRNRIRGWDVRKVIAVCLVASTLIQIVWTVPFMTNSYAFNDTVQIDAYAQALNEGDMSAFVGVDEWEGPVLGNVPSYLIRVPYQAGMVWLFSIVYRLFGNGNYIAIQCLNIISNLVSIIAVIGIAAEATRMGRDDGHPDGLAVKLTAIAATLFLPFLMSAPFVYSNSIAFALVMLACWASAAAWARRTLSADVLGLVGTALLMGLAIMIKQTFLLMSLVLALCWVLHSLREGRPWLLVPVAAMTYAFLHACDLPIWALEQATGVQFGDGQPLFTNITLGLTWSKDGNAPGWYSGAAFDCYNQTDGSLAAQTAWSIDYIKDRLGEMAADPGYAFYFFRYKITSEWLDPSWQSCWFSACALTDGTPVNLVTQSVFSLNRENTLLVAMLDGMQTVLYSLAAIGFASEVGRARRREVPVAELMLVGMALIGLIVYLLWEAQAMYTLPFVFMMLPMVAKGCSMLYDVWDRHRSRKAEEIASAA